jgi:hypothetical protein
MCRQFLLGTCYIHETDNLHGSAGKRDCHYETQCMGLPASMVNVAAL